MEPLVFVGDVAADLSVLTDRGIEAICVDDLAACLDALAAREVGGVVMMCADGGGPGHDALARLREAAPELAVVAVIATADEALACLERGATAYVFASQLSSDDAAEALRAAALRHVPPHREMQLQRELERRNTELLSLNALSKAVGDTLDRDVVISRALGVFAGLCRRGAVGLVALVPDDDEPRPVQRADLEQGARPLRLEIAGQFSGDGSDVFAAVELDEAWRSLIGGDRIVSLDRHHVDGCPCGLDPLLGRLDEGLAILVPVWGQGRPFGALCIAELDGGEDHSRLTPEVLRAMATQLGSALENARLFGEVDQAYQTLKRTQDQLVHAEKFAAMGLLAAEIAHEINNPASFVITNLSVMTDYVRTIGDFVDALRRRLQRHSPELVEAFDKLAETHEIGFLREDLTTLVSRSLGGMQRIHQIVQDLRFFSTDTTNEPNWVDLENLLDATLNLVKHELKYRARLELDFCGSARVFSDANRLSQVYLNLLVNAAHAIEEGAIDDNAITVRTRRVDDEVVVSVCDTGTGIAEADLPQIFEPFFTTKEAGHGTGLGLSISRDIVRSLGGTIRVDSTLGEGTCFHVGIPVRAEQFAQDEQIRDSGSYNTPPRALHAARRTDAPSGAGADGGEGAT